MSIVINDINALDPENQLLTIENNIIVKRVTSINDPLSRYVKFRDFGLAGYDKYFIAYKIDDKIKFLTFYLPELNNDNLTN